MPEPISGLMATVGVPVAAVVIILREVFNFLKDKKNGSGKNTECILSAERANSIMKEVETIKKVSLHTEEISKRIFEMHDAKDGDGVYSWYVPRSWADTQKDIVTILQNISSSQEIIAATLERMERRNS